MLFEYDKSILESEKERNLYTKFFFGYFFNELVEGYDDRLRGFVQLIQNESEMCLGNIPDLKHAFHPNNTHVTSDVHAYLLTNKTDRGELADILLYDRVDQFVIAIEVKFLEDWDFQEDVQAIADRLELVRQARPDLKSVQCLLLKEEKWRNVKKKQRHPGSNYSRLKKSGLPISVITWESLVPLCDNEAVSNFLAEQLTRSKQDFRQL